MIIWLVVRSDCSDRWGNDSYDTPIEALTGDDPAEVEKRAHERLAELEAGAPDNHHDRADDLTSYSVTRVWTVDNERQG